MPKPEAPFMEWGPSNKFMYMYGKGESEVYVTNTLSVATDSQI